MDIDLNADVGESLGVWRMGEDEALIPLVTSVNIACGFHAGDPSTMERTVLLAVGAGATIGAHPGYPDLVGFGRRELAMEPGELEAAVLYQIGALWAFAKAAGAEVRHVKPHGALYNRAARDPAVAEAVVRATRRASADLRVVGPPRSALLEAADAMGLATAAEAFPDRAYEPDGRLRSRAHADSLVARPEIVAERAVRLATRGEVEAIDGRILRLPAETLCIHGDMTGAAERARSARTALEAAGVRLRPLP
jgi:UPF0271 protein